MKTDKELVGTLRGFDDYVSILSCGQMFANFLFLRLWDRFLTGSDMVLEDVTE